MTITEKVAYLKGLSDGLGIDTEKSKEGKLISVIIDILEEMGMSIEDLEENATALGEELDAVSDDLADVEELLYGEDEDEDDECCCGDEDEDDFFEAECPNCKEPLVIDEDVLRAGVIECPSCHSQFAVSDECDCDDDAGRRFFIWGEGSALRWRRDSASQKDWITALWPVRAPEGPCRDSPDGWPGCDYTHSWGLYG